MTLSKTGVGIRPARPEDEPQVLELLDAALGGGPVGAWTPGLFRWKHAENPFGPSFMLVAEAGGRIVGLRAFMRWQFEVAGRTVSAVRAVDTATHPDYRGRGIFSRLTLEALEALRDDIDLVFNTPNEKSLPGYLKMGWRSVGRLPVSIRVLRPVRVLRRLRRLDGTEQPDTVTPEGRAVSIPDALADEDGLTRLLTAAQSPSSGLRTPRTTEYLRWRYGDGSGLGYSAVQLHDRGRLRGLAIFRVRSRRRLWEATVSEVISDPADRSAVRHLLRAVGRSTPVDHVVCHVPPGSTVAGAVAGFVPAPIGITLVVNVLRERLDIDPFDLRSWNLSLGDLEVF